jgi:flagellar biosynthesis/type III secretory pathway M-ring protein FliF/YscJ
MISPELLNVLKQVIISWKVIVTAIGVIIFWILVNKAVRPASKKPKASSAKKIKNLKRPPQQPALDKDIDTSKLNLDE